MIISKRKTEIYLARKGLSFEGLCAWFAPPTVAKLRNGKEVTTRTVYRLCQALECDPADIVDLEVK